MTDPVSRHLRNPLRAYDEDGREIIPPRIGDLRAEGETTAAVFCEADGCGREAIISTDAFPAGMFFPDIALRIRCSGCGGKQVAVRKDLVAYYERLRDQGVHVI